MIERNVGNQSLISIYLESKSTN